MKSTKIITLGMLCLGMTLTFSDCKKKEEPKEPDPVVASTDQETQVSTDSREAQNENDAAIGDVNEVMGNNARINGRGAGTTEAQGVTGPICDVTIDTSLASTGVLKLNYSGTCNNRTRSGTIVLSVQNYTAGVRWKNTGAVVKLDYLNYKVTRTSDQKSIMLNGTQYLTNVSGGTWWNLIILKNQASLVSTVTGTNLIAKWHDNSTATYNINRKFTYTYPSDIITVKCEGLGTSNNINNLENFGTTRAGDAFTSEVSVPMIWNVTCGPRAPLQGNVNIKVPAKNFNLTCLYGLDVNGNPVTVGANQCPFGWKLIWSANTAGGSKLIGYQ